MALVGWEIFFTPSKLKEVQIIAIHGSFMKSSNIVLGGREGEVFTVHRKKNFSIFPSPAGMSLTNSH